MGNGESILCKEAWIPSLFPHKPKAKLAHDLSMYKVSQLFDLASKDWIPSILQENFEEDDTAHIRAIPISIFLTEDRMIWPFERNGVYSVRSATYSGGTQFGESIFCGKPWSFFIY